MDRPKYMQDNINEIKVGIYASVKAAREIMPATNGQVIASLEKQVADKRAYINGLRPSEVSQQEKRLNEIIALQEVIAEIKAN